MVSCEYIIVMVCAVNKVIPHTGGGGGDMFLIPGATVRLMPTNE